MGAYEDDSTEMMIREEGVALRFLVVGTRSTKTNICSFYILFWREGGLVGYNDLLLIL